NVGTYEVTFDAAELTSGLYIYKLDAGSTSITKKMTLLK
ncbi:MAG: peptidase S8, partial [Ignavibacteriaceae bacterium]|nr:peptidase S8 [Ignavibacteriaceae bacterium]